MEEDNNVYILKKKIKETEDTLSLHLYPEKGGIQSFLPGQYINIYFKENKFSEGKPYTISNSPKEKYIQITVKRKGAFSNKLCDMKLKEKVILLGPFGFMTLEEMESKNDDITILASGIGITPFIPIIEESLEKNPQKKINIFYANKNKRSIVFFKKLKEISLSHKSLNVQHFLSREEEREKGKNIYYKRLELQDIKRVVKNTKKQNYFICGPISFVDDFWRDLKNLGIEEDRILTEAFFRS
jgi:ferredoxin-NADP reductase